MKTQAFSLIEVVAALAVTTFAIVGILGLVPVALQSARASQDETQATLIARTISNGLCVFPLDQALFITGPTPQASRPDLTKAASCQAAYSATGQPLAELSDEGFAAGLEGPDDVAYLARITAMPLSHFPCIIPLQITVEAPAQAPSVQRTRFVFVTHVRAP